MIATYFDLLFCLFVVVVVPSAHAAPTVYFKPHANGFEGRVVILYSVDLALLCALFSSFLSSHLILCYPLYPSSHLYFSSLSLCLYFAW